MSNEITPERLDALLDGTVQAETDAERDVLALASRLKGAEPRAGAALRGRVRTIAAEPGRTRRLQRFRGRWALVAAPAVAAIAAGVIAVGVFSGDDKNVATSDATALEGFETQTDAQGALGLRSNAPADNAAGAAKSGATEAAPSIQAPPVQDGPAGADAAIPMLRVTAGTRDARLADIRRIVSDAGGNVEATAVPGATAWDLVITLPVDAAPAALASIAAFADGPAPPIAVDPAGVARLRLTE